MIYEVSPDYKNKTVSSSVPIIYGTQWCGMTQMVRRYFDRRGIAYRYIDLDMNPDAKAQLKWLTGGYASHPTVYIDGQVLIEPSINELQWILAGNGRHTYGLS
jgi:mycoredoxin